MALIMEQSNLFALQCDPGKSLRVKQNELEQFVGSCMNMSVFNLPRSRMYWARAYAKGVVGVNPPLDLDILQKLYYEAMYKAWFLQK